MCPERIKPGKENGIQYNLPGRAVENESHSPASYIETFDVGVQSVARARASHGLSTPNQQRVAHGLGSPREIALGVPEHVESKRVSGNRFGAMVEKNERNGSQSDPGGKRTRGRGRRPEDVGRAVDMLGFPVRTNRPTRRTF
jgi:hypothetical protein